MEGIIDVGVQHGTIVHATGRSLGHVDDIGLCRAVHLDLPDLARVVLQPVDVAAAGGVEADGLTALVGAFDAALIATLVGKLLGRLEGV